MKPENYDERIKTFIKWIEALIGVNCHIEKKKNGHFTIRAFSVKDIPIGRTTVDFDQFIFFGMRQGLFVYLEVAPLIIIIEEKFLEQFGEEAK